MAEPTCRACYAATLTDAERERFNAEPVPSAIHWCADHQRALDDALAASNLRHRIRFIHKRTADLRAALDLTPTPEGDPT